MGGLKPRALPWATLGRPFGASEKVSTANLVHPGSMDILRHHFPPRMDRQPRNPFHPAGLRKKHPRQTLYTQVLWISSAHHSPPSINRQPRDPSHPTGDTIHPSEAPTGRPKVAQGNALGLPTRNTRGLKARPNREALRPDLRPSIRACGRVPGRCLGYRMALGI